MGEQTFQRTSQIEVSAQELRDWHFRAGAFARLNPPWEKATVIESPGALKDGVRAIIEVGMGPIKKRWIAEHEITEDGFIDRQTEGPFASWEHRHSFASLGENASQLTDSIRYRLPLGIAGQVFGAPLVRPKLDRMFRYRHSVTKADLERRRENPPSRALTVLISGATGLIGTVLTGYLQTQGHQVYRLTRNPAEPTDIAWNPEAGALSLPEEIHFDGVIHLAGENVAGGKWTEARKHRILESRRLGTRLIAETIAKLPNPPSVLISASGAGYYSHQGEICDEDGPSGDHFLAEVCRVREAETESARAAGIRIVDPRIGMVLSPAGGALQKLLPHFLLGLGGPVGNGQQRVSWIGMDDVIDVLHRALFEDSWEGPLNLTAPAPVSNHEFSETLGRVLRRPSWFPKPASLLRAIFGQMAEETLLADIAVVPRKLESLGYSFRHSELESALCHLLGRTPPES